MDELDKCRQPQPGKGVAQEVFHRFHVVVRHRLVGLDGLPGFGAKLLVQPPQGRENFGGHGRQLRQRQLHEGDEVFDFHPHPVAHQGQLRKVGRQGGGGTGVAPVEGRKGGEGSKHGGKIRENAGGAWVFRFYLWPSVAFAVPLASSTRRKLIWLAVGLFIVFLSGFLTFLWKRQQLLDYALREVKTRVERKYPVRLTLGAARFTALNTVEIKGMQLVPTRPLTDTLLTAHRIQASLSWRSLFAGRPVFSDLQIEAARLTARKTAVGSNFGFLLKKTSAAPAPRDTALGTNYGLRLNQLLEAGFDNVPTEVNFRDFYVQYRSLHHALFFRLPSLKIEDGDLSGRLSAKVDGEVNELGLTGHIDPSDYELTARVFGVGGSVQVPYVPHPIRGAGQLRHGAGAA